MRELENKGREGYFYFHEAAGNRVMTYEGEGRLL